MIVFFEFSGYLWITPLSQGGAMRKHGHTKPANLFYIITAQKTTAQQWEWARKRETS